MPAFIQRRAMSAALAAICLAALLPGLPARALADSPSAEQGNTAQPAAVMQNGLCAFENDPRWKKARILADNAPSTRLPLADGDVETVSWPQGTDVATVTLHFSVTPASYTMEALDAEGNALVSATRTDGAVRAYLSLPEGAAAFRLTAGAAGALSELHVWSRGDTGGDLLWEPPHEKADLLLIVAHADDEYVMMGGVIPAYAVEKGLNVQVVYCSVRDFTRVREALSGLRMGGITHCPVFLPAEGGASVDLWTELLTTAIRRFRPSVVVTHDLCGEYGKLAHQLASEAAGRAAAAAADPAQYPASAAAFGCWEPLKFYRHLGTEHLIRLDFDHPIAAFAGKTAYEMAFVCYAAHRSQNVRWEKALRENAYDCRVYSLVSSAVGPDEARDDFFEHIPPEAYAGVSAPAATPAPAPAR